VSLVPLAEAQAVVLDAVRALPAGTVPLGEALGSVVSETVMAREPVPPFANTAMDGYAVRAADTVGASDASPVILSVTATLAAGTAPGVVVGPGDAVRIMTGAPLPPGADAVVMVERTTARDDGKAVAVLAPAQVGDHIRPPGEDLAPGQTVVASGTVLTPGHLGLLAAAGRTEVSVHRRPRVGVLSTGDELVDGDAPLEPGQIRDTNRRTLVALAARDSLVPCDLGIVGDDEHALERAVSDAVASCDALLTSGGVSMGEFDYVKVVLDRLSGGRMRWMQIAIKPAKPFAFGVIGEVPVFGLPGNPASSMVSYEVLARPALRKLAGHTDLWRQEVTAVADEDLPRQPDGKLHLVRVAIAWSADDRRFHVRSAGGQGSHLLRSMAGANALALLPDGEGVGAGAEVRVLVTGWPDG